MIVKNIFIPILRATYDLVKFELILPVKEAIYDRLADHSNNYLKSIPRSLEKILNDPQSSNIPLIDLSSRDCQHIIFAPIHNFGGWAMATEATIAKSLSLRRHKVSVLNCESALPACLWNIYGDYSFDTQKVSPPKKGYSKKALCRLCIKKHKSTFSKLNLNMISLKTYSSDYELERAANFVDKNLENYTTPIIYKGINITEHAYSSTLRQLARGTLEEDDLTKFIFRRFMISAANYIDMLEKMVVDQRPDCFVCVHGIYLEHGVLVDFANLHNVRVVVYGSPYRKETIWLAHGDTYHRTLVNEDLDRWVNLDMTDDMKLRVKNHLDSKIAGGRENVNYNPDPILDIDKMCAQIGLDRDKQIVSLFTNTLWDAQVIYQSNIFKDMLDWLFQTIDFFIESPEIQLVIRVHPAETKAAFSTNQPIVAEIQKYYENLPENIFIVAPESDVSSVLLADISTVALIYGTKLGLELAYRKVPLIVAGETLCRGKGFSVDPNSKEEYFGLLKSISTLGSELEIIDVEVASALAERYAYHLFFNLMIDWPFLESNFILSKDATLKFQSLQDLLPGSDQGLDAVCEGILKGIPFEYSPQPVPDQQNQ